jgi:chromate transporter
MMQEPADPTDPAEKQPDGQTTLSELAWLFTKLGTLAFGGPAAHVAVMEDEVVRRRRWMSREAFLDLLGATNLIPGPNSTEMAIHIGYARAGWRGLIVAGSCFILPATVMVGALAWGYVRFAGLPQIQGILYGVKAVVIAVVIQALWRLGRSAIKGWGLAGVGAAAAAANALGVNELVVLLAAACLVAASNLAKRGRPALMWPIGLKGWKGGALAAGATTTAGAAGVAGGSAAGLWPLFLVFLKIGSVLFGSGYVLLAFLRADLVQRLGWLTEQQLLDAVAVGQVTPGPVSTTATFVGYLISGWKGAAVATLGMFLPAFVFVAISGPFVPRLRRSPLAGAFLDGLNVASLALMAVVTWQLGQAALVDWLTWTVALISAGLLVIFRVNATWLIAAGAMIGVAFWMWR